MNYKIMGFVGLDVQDTILYLSRIFYHLGKRVLMADYSESQALYYSMPFIPGIDAKDTIIEYRDTYFTCRQLEEEELEAFDVALFFLGFGESPEIERCTHLVYTTDCEKNHIERIGEIRKGGKLRIDAKLHTDEKLRTDVKLRIDAKLCTDTKLHTDAIEYCQLVFRNAGKNRAKAYALPFAGAVREECRYIWNDSSWEKKLRLQCQYSEVYGFRGLSRTFKRYLKDTARAVFPEECEGKKFQNCFKKAEKGI